MRLFQSPIRRASFIATAFGLSVGGALLLRSFGPGASPFICILNETTGLHCPGCGMTRATHALLDGRLAEAFRFNPVGLILLPIALLALVPEAVAWVRGEPSHTRVRFGVRGGVVVAIIVIAFTVLRNLPWMPFLLLAPPD